MTCKQLSKRLTIDEMTNLRLLEKLSNEAKIEILRNLVIKIQTIS